MRSADAPEAGPLVPTSDFPKGGSSPTVSAPMVSGRTAGGRSRPRRSEIPQREGGVVSVVVAQVGSVEAAEPVVAGPRDLAAARLHGLTAITKAAAGTPDFGVVLRRTAAAARE